MADDKGYFVFADESGDLDEAGGPWPVLGMEFRPWQSGEGEGADGQAETSHERRVLMVDLTEAVEEMRRLGAGVVHVSCGAVAHERPWYCSASMHSPPQKSDYAVGATMDEAVTAVLAKVRAW